MKIKAIKEDWGSIYVAQRKIPCSMEEIYTYGVKFKNDTSNVIQYNPDDQQVSLLPIAVGSTTITTTNIPYSKIRYHQIIDHSYIILNPNPLSSITTITI